MPVDLVSGIVQILGYNDITVGAGFIVSNSGLIATCAHVVQAAGIDPTGKLTVLFQKSGSKCSASVIRKWWSSPDNKDIAILQLEHEIPEGVQVLPLGTSKGTDNHEVESFGFPNVGAIKEIRSKGTVYDRVTDKRGNPLLQIDSRVITAGFSGSPLLDKSKQRVIGMIVSIAKEDPYSRLQTIAFAIPIETLQSVCSELKIEDICPYRGLLSFTEEDQEFFFGREKLVQDLMDQLRSNPRFLALVGSSGSGKSSVISGGLLPRIRQGDILGFENSQIVTFRPGIDPNQSLKREVDLFISPGKFDLWDGIRLYLQKEPDKRLVIFADQFEELFTISTQNEKNRFIEKLINLLESELKVSLILTIRADFYSFLLESEFGKYLSTGQINVRSMSKEEIEQAIEKPAEAIRLQIETGLTNLIITDLKDTKDPLPLLEFTLTKLWERRSDGLLTHNTYHKLGGVTGAIGQWADGTYGDFTDKEKELARRIFTRLIYYGERGTPDSRRRLSLDELAESEDKETIHKLITRLADVHLLVTDRELNTGTETVEIVHDSLLTEWGQLKEWIKEHHTFLLWRQRLETRINEWQMRDKDEGSLLRGAALVEASEWNDKRKKELNQSEKDYIKSSSELKEREQELKEREQELKEKNQLAENQRKKSFIRALSIFSLLILFLAVFAIYEWNQTDKQKQLAEAKTKEASVLYLNLQSSILKESSKTLYPSILLAIESFRINRTLTADQIIRQTVPLIPHSVIIDRDDKWVNDVAFSSDGKYMATASSNNKTRLWNASTGKEVTGMRHIDGMYYLAFSPDGKYITTSSSDNITRLWNISTGKQILSLNHESAIDHVEFSPNGKYIATANENIVCLWDISKGKRILSLNHESTVGDVEFSPDEKYIATTNDNTVSLWDISTNEEIAVLNHDGLVNKVAFSPDGKYIATASWDKTARLWNTSTGKEITILNLDAEVNDIAFSPDGKYIATASSDNTARLWDASTNEEIAVLNHDATVFEVIFSTDGKYIATVSGNTAQLWDISTGKKIAVMIHDTMISKTVFSPDGKYMATVCTGGTSRLWNTSTYDDIVLKHNNAVNKVAFSPNGKYIATASNDKTAILWDASTGEERAVLNHDDAVYDVAFSPDGNYIETASRDNTTWLWNISTGKEITVMERDDGEKDMVFSPDGKYVATASVDKTARLWNSLTGKEITVMKHDATVSTVIFSPDGKYIATVSDDNTTRLWEESTGKETAVLKHDATVSKVIFSPDGKYIATESFDNIYNDTIQLWDVSTGKKITIIKQNAAVMQIVFSPDGEYIATSSLDGIDLSKVGVSSFGLNNTVQLWDVSTGKKVTVMKADDTVRSIAFSPDGKYLATASLDKTVSIWDTSTGEEVDSIKFNGIVNYIAFSPDGKYIATANPDGTARLWIWNTENLISEASTRLTKNLTPQEWKMYMGDKPYHKTFPILP